MIVCPRKEAADLVKPNLAAEMLAAFLHFSIAKAATNRLVNARHLFDLRNLHRPLRKLAAETVVVENSEKAVGEQRDSILAENHAMQDTINGLNDTVERLRNELERAQREMVRRDPQPASSFQNVSSESFLDKRGSIFDDPRLFPTQNAQTSGPMPQIIPQQSWTDRFLVQCSLISKITRGGLRSKKTAEVSKISRMLKG